MDPTSALGALAAASQLAEQVCNIVKFFTELYGKLKEVPDLTRERIWHLEQLIAISKLIAKTRPLQNDEVRDVLKACLRKTIDLNEILKRYPVEDKSKLKHLMQSLRIVRKDDRIIVLLERIEKDIGLLALAIAQVAPAQLQLLNITISEVSSTLGHSTIKIDDINANIQTLVGVTPEMASQVQTLYKVVPTQLGKILHQLNVRKPLVHKSSVLREKKSFHGTLMARSIQSRLLVLIALTLTVIITLGRFGAHIEIQASADTLQPLFEVPNKLVKSFVGREDILSHIETSFESPSAQGPTVVVIRAMGGQGKTQVALKYCQEGRKKMDVFWIDAQSEATARNSFAALSHLLVPSSIGEMDTVTRASTTRRALADRDRSWLMVFDNYDDPKSYDIRGFIPENDMGRVIITSRHQDVEYLAKEPDRIQLQGLQESEAVRLLLSHSEGLQTDSATSEDAIETAKHLAGHPLAIAQAGTYISKRHLTLQEFLTEYKKRQEEILSETTPRMSEYRKSLSETSKEIPVSVFATCELSYGQLLAENKGESVAEILTLLAFFGPGTISFDLLEAYCRSNSTKLEKDEEIPVVELTNVSDGDRLSSTPASVVMAPSERRDHSSFAVMDNLNICSGNGQYFFHTAVDQMRDLSLVENTSQLGENISRHVSLHPLIRDWLRWRTPKTSWPRFSSIVAKCVFELLTSTPILEGDYIRDLSYQSKQQLAAHIAEVAADTELFSCEENPLSFEISSGDKGLPSMEFGNLLYDVWKPNFAKDWYRLAFKYRMEQYGYENIITLRTMHFHAAALNSDGQHAEAEELQKELLDLKTKVLGPHNLDTWKSRISLAQALEWQGRYEESEEITRDVLSLASRFLGEEDYFTITCMGLLGYLLNRRYRFDEALVWIRRASTLATNTTGLQRERTVRFMSYYGESLMGLGMYDEGEKVIKDAFAVSEEILGATHPFTLSISFDFGWMFWNSVSLEIEEELYGNEHKQALIEMNNRGAYLEEQGELEGALAMYERAVLGGRTTLPSDDANLKTWLENLENLWEIV